MANDTWYLLAIVCVAIKLYFLIGLIVMTILMRSEMRVLLINLYRYAKKLFVLLVCWPFAVFDILVEKDKTDA